MPRGGTCGSPEQAQQRCVTRGYNVAAGWRAHTVARRFHRIVLHAKQGFSCANSCCDTCLMTCIAFTPLFLFFCLFGWFNLSAQLIIVSDATTDPRTSAAGQLFVVSYDLVTSTCTHRHRPRLTTPADVHDNLTGSLVTSGAAPRTFACFPISRLGV